LVACLHPQGSASHQHHGTDTQTSHATAYKIVCKTYLATPWPPDPCVPTLHHQHQKRGAPWCPFWVAACCLFAWA
jgi:hypothetical protein